MTAKWLFAFNHFKFPLLPLLTHSALKIHRSSVHKPPTYDLFVQDFVSLGAQIKEHMRIESDSDQSDTFLCENIFSSVNKVQTFVMTHELL